MEEHERKELLNRVNRDSATIGESTADEIDVDGTTVELQELIFELNNRDSTSAELEQHVNAVKVALRRERNEREQLIEDGDISYAEGERLVKEMLGIDRVLNALGTDDGDLEDQEARRRARDQKRWIEFIDQVTSSGDDRRGR